MISALIIINLVAIVNFSFFYRRFKKINKEILEKNEKFMDLIKEQYEDNKELWKYTVACIAKDAVEKEDYETAKRCKDILDNIQKED